VKSRVEDEPPVVVETGNDPVACVIWLHGLGADGHDFEPLVPELGLPDSLSVRFVFPHAPYRPVTLNGGYVMRAWYDIAIDVRGFHQNAAHIRESETALRALLTTERARGIDSRRIVLAGFSQGAAVALHTGLRHAEPLAGIVALSMPIPLAEQIPDEIHASNRNTPVFLAHGTEDQIVPFARGEYARQVLERLALPLEWHAYPMGHTVCLEEVRDIQAWLVRVLATRQ
jgi:phospholipase/carboxylesterase